MIAPGRSEPAIDDLMAFVVVVVLPIAYLATELMPRRWWLSRALDGLCDTSGDEEGAGDVAGPGV